MAMRRAEDGVGRGKAAKVREVSARAGWSKGAVDAAKPGACELVDNHGILL
jgi:hypothetical protein